jgi:hypothetical protein
MRLSTRTFAFAAFVPLLVALPGGSQAGAVKIPKPVISNFAPSLSAIGILGGPITLTADVTNATSCTFTSGQDVTGLPVTVSCSDGIATANIVIPPDGTRSGGIGSPKHCFTISAIGAKTTRANTKLTVWGQPNGQDCQGVLGPRGMVMG